MTTECADDEMIEAVSFPELQGVAARSARWRADTAILRSSPARRSRRKEGVRLAVGGVADAPRCKGLAPPRWQRARRRVECVRLRSRRPRRHPCYRPLSPRSRPIIGRDLVREVCNDALAIGQTTPYLIQVERQARPRRGRAAPADDGFSAPAYRGDGHPCRLRARRLRGLHNDRRWNAGPCLPDARRADRRLRCPHSRRPRAFR